MKQTYKEVLVEKFNNKTALIGIIGLGYVGLPLLLSYIETGFSVVGFDIDKNKLNMLQLGNSYLKHIDTGRIHYAAKSGLMNLSSSFTKVQEVDVLIICVPTPLNRFREPDISYITKTMESVHPYLRSGQIISLESTTYPGTTEEELKPQIESRGFKLGEDFFLVFSPEREDPGNKDYTTRTIPKVVGGVTPNCLDIGVSLYRCIIDKVIPVSSAKAAEMTKLLENIYRAVNIGLVNEMKIVADKMGINIWEVINAASTKPFGFVPFYPGPGWGGHCIPIDPFYLTWKAREFGVNCKFIELAGEINTSMPEWVVDKLIDTLNEHGKPLKGSKILILGIAYKKNIDDMRESPSVKIMELLRSRGVILSYSDPYVPVFPTMRDHKFDLKSVDITEELLKEMDCVVIVTNHDDFDYTIIQRNSKLILDTRGVYSASYNNVIMS